MELEQIEAGVWLLRGLNDFFLAEFKALPEVAAEQAEARERLFPDPVDGREEAGFREDWQDHVKPDLERLFLSARELVARDLVEANKEIVIRRENVDAWLSVLNQARFAMVANYGIEEEELANNELPDISTARGRVLLRMHLYAYLQGMLIEEAF